MQEKNAQTTSVNHLPVVTPPPWGHSSVAAASYLPPTSQPRADPAMLDNLKRQVDQLNNQLMNTTEQNVKLKGEVASLKSQAENVAEPEVESTLIPSQVTNAHASQHSEYVYL